MLLLGVSSKALLLPALKSWLSIRSCSSLPLSSGSSMEVARTDGLAATLWQNSRSLAMLALYHPFVVSLAAGVLRIESFRHYVAQDAYFLRAFAESYGLARDNADDEAAKLSISRLQDAVIEELKLHSSYAQAWGVDLTKEINPNDATVKYTEFLLATAAAEKTDSSNNPAGGEAILHKRKQAAFTIAAMTPCMRLYCFLGQEIAKTLQEKCRGSPYHEWVDTYSSQAFQASTLQIEQLLENLAGVLDEEEIKHLESLYHRALALELEFFSAQPDCQCAHVPIFKRQKGPEYFYLLVSDFDSTCSIADSCPVLAGVSIEAAVVKEMQDTGWTSESLRPSTELRKKWDLLENSYMEQYTSLLNSILPSCTDGSYRCYDDNGLRAILKQLSQFEIQANLKVVEAGVLQGMDMEDVIKAGSQMLLQDGCAKFLRQVSIDCSAEIHILSVCWSKAFIEGALASGGIPSVTVHSNELSQNGHLTSGEIHHRVQTAFDKERILEDILKGLEKRQMREVVTVYIGDSVTDLPCLLNSDLGIVVGSNSTLRKIAQCFGVALVPLYQGILEREHFSEDQLGRRGSGGVLYTVTDWHEIYACLIGPFL